MPLKHVDFRNSELLRSLQKVAQDKGLIQPTTTLVKEAATKLPTPAPKEPTTFSEKIVVLCDGLREQGFHKYASEIESKFLMLKKAELHLYNTTGEEGKDLIEFAHQDGGTKLDKSWGELGTVETILERQSKILDVIRKQPKGKLASKDIINLVKISLGQTPELDTLYATAQKQFADFKTRFLNIAKMSKFDTTSEPLIAGKSAQYNLDLIEKSLADKTIYDNWHRDTDSDTDTPWQTRRGSTVIEDALMGLVANLHEIEDDAPSTMKMALEQALSSYNLLFKALEQISTAETSNKQLETAQEAAGNAPKRHQTTSIITQKGSEAITASDFVTQVEAVKGKIQGMAKWFQGQTDKPSISKDDQKMSAVNNILEVLNKYLQDCDTMADVLKSLNGAALDPQNMTSVFAKTQFFNKATTMDQFKQTSHALHDEIDKRADTVKGW